MKQSRFTETQIVSILKEADAGMKVKDLCRKHGISDATYYNWKSKYGGMEASWRVVSKTFRTFDLVGSLGSRVLRDGVAVIGIHFLGLFRFLCQREVS